jgi:SNF2 family DNA or RNA helicase
LRGAQSVHFVDLHWNPAALFQAEDRPYEPGCTGLTILYYIVRQSVDEHVEHVVLPKIRDMDKVTNEEQAREALAAMSRREQEKNLSLQEIAARIASVCGDEDGE